MATPKKVIEVQNLVKNYHTAAGELEVLKNLSLSVEEGEFVALMGPSGSGKSTFMNILGCLDTVTSGRYILNGVNVADMNKDGLSKLRNEVIGFVFQGFNLLPRITLAENVALPLVYANVDKKTREERAIAMLKAVGLEKFADRRPSQISGGQQQRVAIARALVNSPKLILADEPTGALDSKSTEELLHLFGTINANQQTIVMVTHSTKAASHASRVLFIKDGKIFHEIYKGNKNLDQMYQCISDTLTLLATGGVHHE